MLLGRLEERLAAELAQRAGVVDGRGAPGEGRTTEAAAAASKMNGCDMSPGPSNRKPEGGLAEPRDGSVALGAAWEARLSLRLSLARGRPERAVAGVDRAEPAAAGAEVWRPAGGGGLAAEGASWVAEASSTRRPNCPEVMGNGWVERDGAEAVGAPETGVPAAVATVAAAA